MIVPYGEFQLSTQLELSLISFSTSPSSGKRSNDFLEKINSLSKVTSNTPPPLEISVTSIPVNVCFNSASRLEALGK